MVRQPSPWHITKASQVMWPSPTTTIMAMHISPTTHAQPSPHLLPRPHAPDPCIPTHIDGSSAPSHATTTAFHMPPCPVACPPPHRVPPRHHHRPLCIAAAAPYVLLAAALYVPLPPYSRCPRLPPFAAMRPTPMPPHFGPHHRVPTHPHAQTAPHRLLAFPTLRPHPRHTHVPH